MGTEVGSFGAEGSNTVAIYLTSEKVRKMKSKETIWFVVEENKENEIEESNKHEIKEGNKHEIQLLFLKYMPSEFRSKNFLI